MHIKKIVTHGGHFHADEMSALALLLLLFPDTPYDRTYTPTPEDFEDPTVIVMDIGRRYEPHLNNYDHHQDASLPASNMLILKHFVTEGREADLLREYLFQYISDNDTGLVVENQNGIVSPPTISGIIRACNNLPPDIAEKTALNIAYSATWAYLEMAKKRIAGEEMWAKTIRPFPGVVVHDSLDHIVGWSDLAKKDDVIFLIDHNPRGGWQMTSRDSKTWPIPEHPDQTFLHNSRFIAAYPTLEVALEHAESILNNAT